MSRDRLSVWLHAAARLCHSADAALLAIDDAGVRSRTVRANAVETLENALGTRQWIIEPT